LVEFFQLFFESFDGLRFIIIFWFVFGRFLARGSKTITPFIFFVFGRFVARGSNSLSPFPSNHCSKYHCPEGLRLKQSNLNLEPKSRESKIT
jgi:hypothetical protein